MSNLVAISNPLMRPVQYHGQTYYTGQYFHQMYRANSDADGKYKQASHFLRLIRSIEAYPLYIESGDIVELTWDQVKGDSTNPDFGFVADSSNAELALLFKSNRYNPIMLINATAQVALTHHLDDEVSKQASVAINRQTANRAGALETQQARAATAWLGATLKAAAMLGTDVPMAREVAVDVVRDRVGVDWGKLLANNTVEDAPMNATDLGHLFGLTGRCGAKMHQMLFEQGFAYKDEHGDWLPTEKGKPYCTCNPYKSPHSEHSGYRTLWYRRVLDVLAKEGAA